jgi:hypothetical protein
MYYSRTNLILTLNDLVVDGAFAGAGNISVMESIVHLPAVSLCGTGKEHESKVLAAQ